METTKKNKYLLAGLLAAYPIGFLYVKYAQVMDDYRNILTPVWMVLFSLVFIVWNEVVLRGRREKGSKKSFFWYGIMIALSVLAMFSPSRGFSIFAIHMCAIYASLVSNEAYLQDEADKLMVFDMFNGLLINPLSNLGAIFQDIAHLHKSKKNGVSEDAQNEEKNKSGWSVLIGFMMILFSIPLFFIVVGLLTEISDGFSDMVEAIADFLFFDIDLKIISDLLFAIPVTFYLYGVVRGNANVDIKKVRESGEKINGTLDKLKTASVIASRIIGTVFVLLYLVFFIVGGSYFFGAFAGIVPGHYTAAEYARSGFFQLLAIMVINMVIYLMLNSLSDKSEGKSLYGRVMIISLMGESIIFSIISLSKLILYFKSFGYTDSRVFAIWWVIIIAVAAGFIIANVLNGRNYLKKWIYFVAISYILLSIISCGNIVINGRYKSYWIYNYSDIHDVESIEYTYYVDDEEVGTKTIEIDGDLYSHQYKIDIPDRDDVKVDIRVNSGRDSWVLEDVRLGYDSVGIYEP